MSDCPPCRASLQTTGASTPDHRTHGQGELHVTRAAPWSQGVTEELEIHLLLPPRAQGSFSSSGSQGDILAPHPCVLLFALIFFFFFLLLV